MEREAQKLFIENIAEAVIEILEVSGMLIRNHASVS